MDLHKSGYVALLGRPNVGKSTLLNRVLGQKLSIVSSRPQTTRNRILGIHNQDDAQILFLDTPGVHEARSLLNRRMVEQAVQALGDVDLVVLLIDPRFEDDPEKDRLLLEQIERQQVPALLVPNKIDQVPKASLLPVMDAWAQGSLPLEGIVPISAKNGDGVDVLLAEILRLLPEGPAYFPKDQITDVSERFVVAELIREKLFHQLNQELPYAVAVQVEEFELRKDGKHTSISARIWVERDSQKGIVIGKKGSRLKSVGTAARYEIERLLGTSVFLKLTVGVDPRWTRHRRAVERYGMFDAEKSR